MPKCARGPQSYFSRLDACIANDKRSARSYASGMNIDLRAARAPVLVALLLGLLLNAGCRSADQTAASAHSGNPVLPGWYADPEGVVFGKHFWIYPTSSAPYGQQVFLDAFSSPDLVHWAKHGRILDTNAVTWARRAMWAPAMVMNDGKYFLFFAANDIQNNDQTGGIGVAVADKPGGPFQDYLGKPLVGRFHNGAQPIDQFVFRDRDGQYYMIYGGWRHCNIARLAKDFRGFEPFADQTVFKEITPQGYVEGPFMFLRDGKYYFMWSEGGWTGPDYSVAYAIADSPLGPFKRIGKILQQDPKVATGAGHHSVIQLPGKDVYYIVYHRRPLGERDGNHRVVCIDRMEFDEQGFIQPVQITFEGVPPVKP
jgi:beta-xylosidase